MRIIYITAGAAGMYCGSCFRDNALARELLRRGHDVLLVPAYTPTRTDEPNVSEERVFFGGISVYLEQHVPLFRKTPLLLDKLWDSRLALKLATRSSIQVNPKKLGKLTVSTLKGEDGFQRKEVLKLVNWLASEAAPDVVNLPNSLLIGLARSIKHAVDCPVCCTLQGEDLFISGLPEPYRAETLELIRSQVRFVDRFLAVSDYYAEFMMRELSIPENKIEVAPLGINLEGYSMRQPDPDRPFTIGFFARIAPEKGLHVLCEAYHRLRERNEMPAARLEAAGYLGAEYRDYLRGIERKMGDWGLASEFNYRGELDRREKIEFIHSLDLLSVPATYDEPKGMFLLEAMANGVPVVQPRRGAFTEMIERTGGGILVEPDDPNSLAEGLMALFKDRSVARRLGEKGYDGVRKHYSVQLMADRSLEVYESVLAAGSARVRRARSASEFTSGNK